MYKILFPFLGFNSTLVQLKVSGQRQGYPQSYWFQFYLSSIKRPMRTGNLNGIVEFQFYLSSIKRQSIINELRAKNMFQFYLSSIKR